MSEARAQLDAEVAAARQRHRAGDVGGAETAYRSVLARDPAHADALYLLGIATHQRGRHGEAAALIERAIASDGSKAEYWRNLAMIRGADGRLEDAVAAAGQALARDPADDDALNHLGATLGALGRHAEAVVAFERLLARAPNHKDALNNLSSPLTELGRFADAARHLEAALALDPGFAAAWFNLAYVRRMENRFAEAHELCRRALALDPALADARLLEAALLADQGRHLESIVALRAEIARRPDSAEAHWSLGLALLLTGQWEEGWREHEWRWRRGALQFAKPAFAQLPWDGGDLAGRTILLYAEQGLGDAIQFVRYAAPVKARGAGRVLVRCSPKLHRLLATAPGVDALVAPDDAPAFDIHAALMSLPGIFGTTPPTAPAPARYLAAEPARVERWRARLGGLPRPWIGLNWQGNPTYKGDFRRSIPLARLAPALRATNASFVSLHKGTGEEQIAAAGLGGRLHAFADMDTGPDAFLDTAAIMAQLDLVVSSDTATVHLAGALGRPIWTLLSATPDWRWGLGGESTPWYPAMRLLRQPKLGDWDAVAARLGAELAKFAV